MQSLVGPPAACVHPMWGTCGFPDASELQAHHPCPLVVLAWAAGNCESSNTRSATSSPHLLQRLARSCFPNLANFLLAVTHQHLSAEPPLASGGRKGLCQNTGVASPHLRVSCRRRLSGQSAFRSGSLSPSQRRMSRPETAEERWRLDSFPSVLRPIAPNLSISSKPMPAHDPHVIRATALIKETPTYVALRSGIKTQTPLLCDPLHPKTFCCDATECAKTF